MKAVALSVTFSIAAAACAAGSSYAADYDHLKCYKIKDQKTFKSAAADLDALQARFGLENCRIKPAAKLMCVPATKTVTELVDGTPEPVAGVTQSDSRLCYKIKCPKSEIEPLVMTDQFGTREVRGFKAVRLCTPAIDSAPSGGITLVKLTNGTDNDTPPGPTVPVGSTVTFTYLVTNPGADPISGVIARDDNGTPGVPADDFNATFVGGDTNANGLLDPAETFTFVASRIVTPGPYANIGTASGTLIGGETATDSDPDHHVGILSAP